MRQPLLLGPMRVDKRKVGGEVGVAVRVGRFFFAKDIPERDSQPKLQRQNSNAYHLELENMSSQRLRCSSTYTAIAAASSASTGTHARKEASYKF